MRHWIMGLAAVTLSATLASAAFAQPGGERPGGRDGGIIRKACQADIEQLCGNTEPGGGRIGQCLRDHQDRLSEACKSAISEARAGRGRRQDQTPPAPPPAPTSPN